MATTGEGQGTVALPATQTIPEGPLSAEATLYLATDALVGSLGVTTPVYLDVLPLPLWFPSVMQAGSMHGAQETMTWEREPSLGEAPFLTVDAGRYAQAGEAPLNLFIVSDPGMADTFDPELQAISRLLINPCIE